MADDSTPKTTAPSIRKLLVRLVLLVYLPALLALVVLAGLEMRGQLELAREQLLERTVLLSRTMRFRMEGLRSNLERLAREIPTADGDWKAFHHDASRTATATGLDAIVLHAADGKPMLDTRVAWGKPLPALPRDVPSRSATTVGTGYLDAAVEPVSRRLVVGVAVPVVRAELPALELRASIDARRLRELLGTTPAGWISGLLDSRGTVIAGMPDTEDIGGWSSTGELRARIAEEEQGVYQSVARDNAPVMVAFTTRPSIGWTTVMSVPRSTLHAPVWRTAALLATIAAVLLAFALWLSARLQRSIVHTVEVLDDEAVDAPHDPHDSTLAFEEAQQVLYRLKENAAKLAAARRAVDRINAQFQRRLLQQMDRRQVEIATELHDHVGSGLAGISLLLANLRRHVAQPGHALLDNILGQVDRTAQGVRDISRGIMPAGEQQGGLPAAIEQLVLSQQDAVACDFRCQGDFTRLPPEAAGHLYRIVQEALANSQRHGGATRVRITLAGFEKYCRLTIDDNGAGYGRDSHSPLQEGMGLRSMRGRAMALDGDIEFTRSPLGGSRVRVTWAHQH